MCPFLRGTTHIMPIITDYYGTCIRVFARKITANNVSPSTSILGIKFHPRSSFTPCIHKTSDESLLKQNFEFQKTKSSFTVQRFELDNLLSVQNNEMQLS